MSSAVSLPFSAHVNTISVKKTHVLWHHRLGHIPFSKLQKIDALNVSSCDKQPFLCHVCPLARQQRIPLSTSQSHSPHIFDLVHVDV